MSEVITEVGEFIAQSKQNAESLRSLRADFTTAIDSLRSAVERIGDKLNTATRPNISTFVSICGVMVGIISLIGGVIGFFLWNAIVGLDTKLQKEFQLSITTATQAVENVNSRSLERHEAVSKAVDRIHTWEDSHDAADLEELRQRRLKDVSTSDLREQIKKAATISGTDHGQHYER